MNIRVAPMAWDEFAMEPIRARRLVAVSPAPRDGDLPSFDRINADPRFRYDDDRLPLKSRRA